MPINLTPHKVTTFPNINDVPVEPTASKAGNGAHLINKHNNLIDSIQSTLNLQRNVLQANLLYYVSPNGLDTNDGLTNGTPFKTIQKFINVASSHDLNGFVITGVILEGTYTEAIELKPFIGNGYIRISGNGTTQPIITHPTARCIVGNFQTGKYQLDNFRIVAVADAHIAITDFGHLEYWNITFAGTNLATDHIVLYGSKVHVRQIDVCTIETGGTGHLYLGDGACFSNNNSVCTIVGTPNFTDAFVWADYRSYVDWRGGFTGSATGKKFEVRRASTVIVSNSLPDSFPGDVPGTVGSGGIYINGARVVTQ